MQNPSDPTREETIYHAAAVGNVARIQTILEEGIIDLSIPDSQKRLALHWALILPGIVEESLRENKKRIAGLLIDKAPGTLAYQDDAGETAVHLMALGDFHELLVKALEYDEKLAFVPNNEGMCPIHIAIANQCVNVIDRLLAVPDMASLLDNEGRTLMHHAALMNNCHVLNGLFSSNKDDMPDINRTDDNGDTALDIASRNGFSDIIELLKEHGGKLHERTSQNSVI